MADLLGSILGSMQKPPSLGEEEIKRRKEHKARHEKLQQQEKARINKFTEKIQKQINEFINDPTQQKYKFDPMSKVDRAIVHEIAEVASLTSFSFGEDELDRYVMLWKKEYAPSDEELLAYRRGEVWDPAKAKEVARQQELERQQEIQESKDKSKKDFVPNKNYMDKFERIIGKDSAKDAAKLTTANKSYGFVPSENKRDQRTIEQVMEQSRQRKKLKSNEMKDVHQGTSVSSKEDGSNTG